MLDSLSLQRKRFVIGSGVAGLVLVGLIASLALRSDPHPDANTVPVMLIHGYGGSPADMQTLATALRHEHRTVEAVALPQHGEGDIDRSAQVVAQAVAGTGASKVDLVGFSAGSIVVRTYLSTPAGKRGARRVVLLGAPNHGAVIASLAVSTDPSACVDACQQVARGSGLLRRLNSHPVSIPIVSIWTANDMVVTPPRSAVLHGATNIEVQSICPQASLAHSDLITDPAAIGLTIEALEGRADVLQGCGQVRRLGANALSS